MYNLIYIPLLSKASLVYEKNLYCRKIKAYRLKRVVNADHSYILFATI